MDNLYNKIYEAIDTGIQKALIISDGQFDDVSVNWHEKKKTNDIDIMGYYVDKLLNDENKDYYFDELKSCYKTSKKKYKVTDFDKLSEIMLVIRQLGKLTKNSLNWIDMSNFISVILSDGSEVEYTEIDKQSKPIFLKISDNQLKETHNEILLYLNDNFLISNTVLKWQTKEIQIQDDQYFTDKHHNYNLTGYDNCKNILRVTNGNNKFGDIEAIQYCTQYNINGHQGYLPSLGQLHKMILHYNLIEFVLKYIDIINIKMPNLVRCDWWSSTEYSKYAAYALHDGLVLMNNKRQDCKVLPVFKY